MPSITCLAPLVRDILLEALEENDAPSRVLTKLRTVPDCPSEELVGFGRAKGVKGVARKPNARAQWIGACIKTEYARQKQPVPQLMRECSARWRQQKAPS